MGLKVGEIQTTTDISGGGFSSEQKLDFLKQLMPKLTASRRDDGQWWLSGPDRTVEKYVAPGVRQSSPLNGATKEEAIDSAFRYYTEGAPTLVLGHPDSSHHFEAKWAGNGWQTLKGVLPGAQVGNNGQTGTISQEQKATIGAVGSKETLPTRTIIGVYHKEKSSNAAMQLIDRGFEADKAGNFEKALKDYKVGLGVLIGVVTKNYEKELQSLGVDPIKMAIDQNPIIFQRTCEELGIFQKEPEVKTALLKYYNRSGLADKHRADSLEDPDAKKKAYGDALFMCHLANELQPGYGPALYNSACIAWKGLGDEKEALNFLEQAIADKNMDFKKLALNDTDWNDLRNNARFRELVGLPALQKN